MTAESNFFQHEFRAWLIENDTAHAWVWHHKRHVTQLI